MIHKLFAALCLALGLFIPGAAAAQAPDAPTLAQKAEMQRLTTLEHSLHPQTGVIPITGADVTLTLGQDYYFLSAAEAKKVIVDGWGNPPENGEGVLGMIFPAGKTFLDDTWGAVITFTGDGYVSDEDASKIDYAKLLEDLRKSEAEENRSRQAAGYPGIHIAGWAQQPSYDPVKHNLIWARELTFTDTPVRTLNYDVRVLGRRGVLSMNIIAGMRDLPTVGPEAAKLMATASFNPGATYADYKPGSDQKAAYGVAGLIAGGAVLAVAKKAGLIGIVLLVLKKGAVFLIAAFGGAWAWLKRLFGGKSGGDFSRKSVGLPETDAAPYDPTAPDPGLAPIVPPGDGDGDKPL